MHVLFSLAGPDDSTSTGSNSKLPILTGIDNFFKWRETIEGLLVGMRAMQIVLGHEPQPALSPNASSTELRLLQSWQDRDAKAMGLIRQSCGGAVRSLVRGLSSSTQMWALLKELHNLGTPEHRASLNRRVDSLFLDSGGDMLEHLDSFMELVAEADAAELGWGQYDNDKIYKFLDTLHHDYQTIHRDLRALPEKERTFFALIRIYKAEDAARKHSAQRSVNAVAMASAQVARKGQSTEDPERHHSSKKHAKGRSQSNFEHANSSHQPSSGSGLTSKRGTNVRGRGRGRGGLRGSGRPINQSNTHGNNKNRCYGCGSWDHIRPECPVASHVLPGQICCWNCHQIGHSQDACPKKKSNPGTAAAAAYDGFGQADDLLGAMFEPLLAASTTSTLVSFMIDSGASQHIIDRTDLLSNQRKSPTPLNFQTVGSMRSSDLIGDVTGTLEDGRKVTFQGVVSIPGAGVNLLSEELLRERGWVKVVNNETDEACLQHRSQPFKTMPLTKRGRTRWITLRVNIASSSSSDAVLLSAQDKIKIKVKEHPLLPIHLHLGHLGFSTIVKLIKLGHLPDVPGYNVGKPECDSCETVKATRSPFNEKTFEPSKPLELVFSDIAGPLVPAHGGYTYYATFIDAHTRLTDVRLLRNKNEVFHEWVLWVKRVERIFGHQVQVLRTDGGGEYVNKYFSNWMASHGVVHHITTPHTPELNGVAERKNRTLKEMAAAMLHSSGLPTVWWGHAILFAAVLLMKVTFAPDGRTVWEWVHKRKPTLSKSKAFGSQCWVHVPAADRSKADLTTPKAWKGILVSWPTDRSGWGIYNKTIRRVIFSRNVSFGSLPSAKVNIIDRPSSVLVQDEIDVTDHQFIDMTSGSDADDELYSEEEEDDTPVPRGVKRPSPDLSINPPARPSTSSNLPQRPQGSRQLPARASRGLRQTGYWNSYATFLQDSEGFLCKVTLMDDDPISYQDAMERPDHAKWSEAFDKELKSLIKNKTLEEVVLPPGAKVVSTKWVCKTKRDADGNYIKHKARLVGRGFTQRYGIDYDETYAPVGRMTSLRIFFVVAARDGLIVWQMDAETAFLNPTMDRVLYISFPEGWEQTNPQSTGLLVRKGLYGFKQSARLWWLDVFKKLKDLGFNHSDADWGIFIRVEPDGTRTIVFVYVDDFLIAASTQQYIDSVRNGLKAAYTMSDIGPVSSVLGVKIHQDHGSFTLQQGHYIDTVLERFNMSDCRPEPTPVAVGTKLVAEGVNLDPQEVRNYQALIGCLMWTALSTRPDISFAVSALSRFNGSPTFEHMNVAKRVLRYLKGTRDYGLLLRPVMDNSSEVLRGYSDADWAGNHEDRKSQSGYVFQLYGCTISWGSLRQQCVSLSSVESEYVALTEAIKDAIWLRTAVMAFQQVPSDSVKIVLNGDNQGSIALAQNPAWHRRTKHIDLRYHFVRWQVEEGTVKLTYVSTSDQVADIFTKATPAPTLIKHRTTLAVLPLLTPSSTA